MKPNIAALRSLIDHAELDALVCMTPENFTYVSGAYISTLSTIRPRQGFAVIPRSGDPALVICSVERAQAAAESWVEDIRVYTEFRDDPVVALVALLKEAGLGSATIGMDMDYLPASSFGRLTDALPGLRFVNTTDKVAAIRAIKTQEEVALLETTTRSTHRAVLDAMAASRSGETERTMANRIANGLIEGGANGILFLHFGSGERSAHVHGYAADIATEPGEIIRLDVAGTYGPWSSDLARTYSSGTPSETQRDTYRHLRDIQATTIASMRPGVPAEDVFFTCRDAFERHGLPCFLPHIGHSFGIELHEAPMIRPGDKTPLAAGMVINIEPMTLDEEGACYHTEDLVLITDEGHRLLTLGLAPKEIPSIGSVILI